MSTHPASRGMCAGGTTLLALLLLAACKIPQESVEVRASETAVPAEPSTPLPAQTGSTYLNIGRQLLNSNQPDLAQDAFIRSLRVEGLTAAALNGAGLASERLGLLHDAKRYFKRAAKLDPNSITAQNNLGAVHYRLAEYHAAKRAFLAAYKLSSGTNTVADQNLQLVEFALQREEQNGLAEAANPVPLQRLGTGEYILGTATATENDG